MPSIKYYLTEIDDNKIKGVVRKNVLAKRSIITYMSVREATTLLELASELKISIPTTTKLVAEMVDEGIVGYYGKIETTGGRRPNLYGLSQSSIYFAGVNVAHRSISYVITDIKNNIIDTKRKEAFVLKNTKESMDELCMRIKSYIASTGIDGDKIIGVGVTLPGRVNSTSGYSYYYFNNTDKPLSEILSNKIGFKTLIENDTRASCYAEYMSDKEHNNVRNMIYFYLSHGLAVGIIIDGKLYYGKSGFAGEFGHIPSFNNNTICQCGKKGCLETEVSGVALEKQMVKNIEDKLSTVLQQSENITLADIIEAAHNDDVLSIEMIQQAGEKAGRAIATLINLFNPELFVVGGTIASAGDYFMLPMKTAVNKYSHSLVNNDTEFRISKLSEDADALGGALLIRKKLLEL